MHRRRALSLIGSSAALAVAGCLGFPEPEPAGRQPTSSVREWARDAEAKAPVRATGEPVSLDRTVTDDPGYEEDGFEYFQDNRTYRYVEARSGGEPVAYDTWPFEKWGRLKSATKGSIYAGTIAADRLDVEGVGNGISSPPDGSAATAPIIGVHVTKTLDREGEVVEWPVATFPDLKEAAPRSVDVTLTIEGDTFSRTVPVYAEYIVRQYA